MFLNIEELGLPKDVVENSGMGVQLVGEITGDNDEIIVISQLGRRVGTAYVCHLSNGYERRNKNLPCKVICDIPNFPKLVIASHMEHILIREINGTKYTMACLADSELESARANWLH